MLGIALRYHEYDGCLIAGFALYGLGLAACCVLLHHRRHPLIHRLSPRLLALAHFAAFVWWLTVANNAALAGLWAVLRFPCRVWQVIARCSAFTAYCSCVLARLYIVRSRWLSVDKTRATRTLWCAAAAVVGLCIALITLILLLQSGPRSDCNLNDAQELAYVIYCGVYLIAICVLSVLLGNTVYLDTKADYRVLHPKAYNATIDFLGTPTFSTLATSCQVQKNTRGTALRSFRWRLGKHLSQDEGKLTDTTLLCLIDGIMHARPSPQPGTYLASIL
ncbi:hypothetical protein DIPPA_01130 [Diplonema papillatum]|nr:hypothetical protein DIPPA_01130 [Diplonema papillatum]